VIDNKAINSAHLLCALQQQKQAPSTKFLKLRETAIGYGNFSLSELPRSCRLPGFLKHHNSKSL